MNQKRSAIFLGVVLAMLVANLVIGASAAFDSALHERRAAIVQPAMRAMLSQLYELRDDVAVADAATLASALPPPAQDGYTSAVIDAGGTVLAGSAAAGSRASLVGQARRGGDAVLEEIGASRLAGAIAVPPAGRVIVLDLDLSPRLDGLRHDVLMDVLPQTIVMPVLALVLLVVVLVRALLARDGDADAARIAALEHELRHALDSARQSASASAEMLRLLGREVRTALSTIIGFAQIIEQSDHEISARHAHKIALAGHDLLSVFDSVAGVEPRDEAPQADADVDGDADAYGDADSLASLLAGCPTETDVLGSAGPRRASAAAPAAAIPARPGHGILVVEDDAFNQEVIKEQIRMIGLPVSAVSSGEEALACWHEFSIIVTDINMPGIDGYELAATIRRAEAGREPRVAIIALTANAGPSEAQRCREAGMDDYLAKPVDFMLLKKKLAEWGGA